MDTAAWIVSGLLAALYVGAGLTKLTQPITALRPQMSWVDDIPFGLVRFIGASELLGAAGLLLRSCSTSSTSAAESKGFSPASPRPASRCCSCLPYRSTCVAANSASCR